MMPTPENTPKPAGMIVEFNTYTEDEPVIWYVFPVKWEDGIDDDDGDYEDDDDDDSDTLIDLDAIGWFPDTEEDPLGTYDTQPEAEAALAAMGKK